MYAIQRSTLGSSPGCDSRRLPHRPPESGGDALEPLQLRPPARELPRGHRPGARTATFTAARRACCCHGTRGGHLLHPTQCAAMRRVVSTSGWLPPPSSPSFVPPRLSLCLRAGRRILSHSQRPCAEAAVHPPSVCAPNRRAEVSPRRLTASAHRVGPPPFRAGSSAWWSAPRTSHEAKCRPSPPG